MTPRPPRTKPVTVPRASASRPSAEALYRADQLAITFKILGNANRLRILVFLDEHERSVSEIETELEIHQPTLSQQLGELRDARLIVGRRVAKSVIYALTEELGQRALETIYLASGHKAAHAPVQPPPRPASHQAAVFAAVLSTRGCKGTDAPASMDLGREAVVETQPPCR